MKAKERYEECMKDVMCPLFYKVYSQEALKWVQLQLDKGRIKERRLYFHLKNMIVDIEKMVKNVL